MKPADDLTPHSRPARRGSPKGRGPWLMLAIWICVVAVLFVVGVMMRGL